MVSTGAAGLERMLAEGRVSRGGGGGGGDCAPSAWGVWRTGVAEMDAALPGGGLRRGTTHEWFTEGDGRKGGEWAPALAVVLGVMGEGVSSQAARQPDRGEAGGGGSVVFVGRRCWPVLWGARAARWVFVDPECDAARVWAIDQALRCPGVDAVVADAMRLDMAGSRRLQLAAEAGGVTGFLMRPWWERGVISAAETRWSVRCERPRRMEERRPRWRVELTRCKGSSLAKRRSWVVELLEEVNREACALRVPADVVGGSGETEGAAVRIA